MRTDASYSSDVFATDWRDTPYWLDGLDPLPADSGDLPEHSDVLVIGSGYTGLNAAVETARGGRSTLVIDAKAPGWGCSTRNGGQISASIKPSLAQLSSLHSPCRGRDIRHEGETSLTWIENRIASEGIDCAFRRTGRFHGAHTPKHYEILAREADRLRREESVEVDAVPRSEQSRDLGTDTYHGGVVFHRHASLDPARYHRGLFKAALAAGARVVGNCAAAAIRPAGSGYEVTTERGIIRAADVVVATNGYTAGLTPWLQRRIIPIGSYVIVTAPLPKGLVDQLFPTDRTATDTRKVVYYYRASPDRTRIVFGGRVSAGETDLRVSAPRLHDSMCQIFPDLRSSRISHAWMGYVAYTFDQLPHTGTHGGLHYAMGYCGSGVGMASYLGMRLGQKVLGLSDGLTALDDLPFSTRPLYRGRPWFLPPLVAWHRWRDRQQYSRAANRARAAEQRAGGNSPTRLRSVNRRNSGRPQ